MKSSLNHKIALFWVIVIGFAIRVWGIDFGLPHLFHADEPIIVNHALAYGTGDLNPRFFNIPPLISYLCFTSYGLLFLVYLIFGLVTSISDYQILFFSDPSIFYRVGRILFGAVLGTASIFLIYRICRKYFNERAGIWAAVMLGFAFIHVRESHYLYVDIPLTIVSLIFISKLLNLVTKPVITFRDSVIIGLLVGLATAVKYNGVFLCVPALMLFAFHFRSKGIVSLFIAFTLSIFAAFILLNPYSILDINTFLSDLLEQSRSHGGDVRANFTYHMQTSFYYGLGPSFGLLCILAWFTQIRVSLQGSEKLNLLLLWSYIAFYFGVLIFKGQPYERYILPLVPFLIIVTAVGMVKILSFDNRPLRIMVYCLYGLFLTQNIIQSVLFANIMTRPDVRSLATKWVESNIATNSSIALDLDFAMPRLKLSESELRDRLKKISSDSAKFNKLNWLIDKERRTPAGYRLFSLSDNIQFASSEFLSDKNTMPYDLNTLKSNGINYVIITRLRAQDAHNLFYAELAKKATLVAQFNPYKDPSQYYSLQHPLTGGPFLWSDLWKRERNGHPISIYKLG